MTTIRSDRGPLPGLLLALVLLPLVPSWLGLLGGWHWQLDLLAHFRWQYLFVGAVILVWGLWMRQRAVIVAALITCLLNGALIGQLAWRAPDVASASSAGSLRFVSFNLLSSNSARQPVLDYLLATDADVIFLMEVNAEWMAALQILRERYPHGVAQPQRGNFGVALFSRVPLVDAEVLDIGSTGLPSVQAKLTMNGREITFIGTHPMPPVGRDNAALWRTQLAALADQVAHAPLPVLLAGDLNATPWSAGMRVLTRGNLGFRSQQAAWAPTWSASSPFAIPIDHALCTAPLVVLERRVGPDLGSDHRPLHLTVGWAEAGS